MASFADMLKGPSKGSSAEEESRKKREAEAAKAEKKREEERRKAEAKRGGKSDFMENAGKFSDWLKGSK